MPRSKKITRIDRRTGESVTVETFVPGEATIQERFIGMLDAAQRAVGEDAEMIGMWVKCDGCGIRVAVDRPELPEGWLTRPGGEFCQQCR